MRTLGIIGGVSWHSTAQYYKLLNESVARSLGHRHSARIVLSSVDFADLLEWQKDKTNKALIDAFLKEGQRLKAAGCQSFIIASHTLTWLGDIVEAEIGIKHISLYDSIFNKLRLLGATRVGLTGTRYTMQDPVYRAQYERAGFKIAIPHQPHLTRTASIVYNELVQGIFLPESMNEFAKCFENLVSQGVDAIVLGCTEIGLLISSREWASKTSSGTRSIPMLDTIETHATNCVGWMLAED
ncbi:MAG: aspartate/glutamate racemase family protein [Silvanigrellaceae bacterium]